MNNKYFAALLTIIVLLFISNRIDAQRDLYEVTDIEKVKFSTDDFGKMWTFDDVPAGKWQEQYGFNPTAEWLEDVRKSALQFQNGCSAAFVSQEGLIMTNHHCGRGDYHKVQKEGENLLRDGFYAETLNDERRIPNLYVDQLIMIKDVTTEIVKAINSGVNDEEKIKLRNEKISELENNNKENTGMINKVVTLYNGGKYSLYTYKRYEDVRLVMAPDFQIASTGWDWDNFTYPRYELDFAFYRAYDENGNPVKTDNYFKWSEKGADEDEPIFIVGRPGSTRRQLSIAELSYLRDEHYPHLLKLFNEKYDVYYELFNKHPERESELLNRVMGWGNARKSYGGRLLALRDEYVMKKKRDFEIELKNKVNESPDLKEKYGSIWQALETSANSLRKISNEFTAFNSSNLFTSSAYYEFAKKLIELAEQIQKPEEERKEDYKDEKLQETINLIYPNDFDKELNDKLVTAHVNTVVYILGNNHELVKNLYGTKRGEELAEYLLSKSKLTSKESLIELAKSSPEEILSSDDPFIQFILMTRDRFKELQKENKELTNTVEILNQRLGEVIFKIYGDLIPPDATSTLRISDGVIKGYEYNGTIAPGKTTYYGLYDRYFSFGGATYPYGLHERWKIPADGLDLSTPLSFAATNDIVGGNSGSSIINRNQEVIGLVHDGNLQSLAGDVIFLEENNRSVATDSYGLMQALIYVFKTERLVNELQNSKIVD
ncbi:MAG: S46 family peptidase [Bacteroidetes bacterium]|nr:S46 family peptidase [Bacteroidota bacterium]